MSISGIYNMADSYFIGKYTGTIGLTAISIANPLEMLLPVSVIEALLTVPAMEWILTNILGASDEVLPHALAYLRVIFAFTPIGYYLTTTVVGSLRIENKAQWAMWLETAAALINIIGDPILM
ncbi:hypothetical protein KIPB_012414, partial [Kipferlia bialata]|eukprot:g12414.t1